MVRRASVTESVDRADGGVRAKGRLLVVSADRDLQKACESWQPLLGFAGVVATPATDHLFAALAEWGSDAVLCGAVFDGSESPEYASLAIRYLLAVEQPVASVFVGRGSANARVAVPTGAFEYLHLAWPSAIERLGRCVSSVMLRTEVLRTWVHRTPSALFMPERPSHSSESSPFVKAFEILVRSARLTARQRQVLWLFQLGDSVTRIGLVLHISPETARNHLDEAFRRVGVKGRPNVWRVILAHACE